MPSSTSVMADSNCPTRIPITSSRRPNARRRVTHSRVLYCPDVDDVVARAEKAGATIREGLQTFVTGDRFASIRDAFGQRWAVMTRVEQVDAEERDRKLAEWANENV